VKALVKKSTAEKGANIKTYLTLGERRGRQFPHPNDGGGKKGEWETLFKRKANAKNSQVLQVPGDLARETEELRRGLL